ncbi:hypothetical protein [Aminobacter sp. Piv2-1]|uniref:hypothetical protein n=1 Tax=Aminobacter sp. Piv2-1 TaxID=3031122 RepID=UPI0030AA782D
MRTALALTGILPLAMAAAIALAAPASAGGWDGDRIYADSFGNLVVESGAGYKRIVVGEGGSARKLAAGAGPKVVYLDRQGRDSVRRCYRPPMLLKGRSYMYGFSEGEIPQPGLRCR